MITAIMFICGAITSLLIIVLIAKIEYKNSWWLLKANIDLLFEQYKRSSKLNEKFYLLLNENQDKAHLFEKAKSYFEELKLQRELYETKEDLEYKGDKWKDELLEYINVTINLHHYMGIEYNKAKDIKLKLIDKIKEL